MSEPAMQSDYSELVERLKRRAAMPFATHDEKQIATAITTLQAERDNAWNDAIEAAAQAAMGYVHPDPARLPGEMFASAQIRAMKKDTGNIAPTTPDSV